MKKKMSLLLTFVLILGISTNALAMDNAEDSSESCKVLLPETFSFDVTMDEIANSIDQYIVEHNMKINRNTEEYAELLHNFCVSDFPDLTETELRYYQAYASVYLSGSMDESTYISNDSKTIGEIRKENQEMSERILETSTHALAMDNAEGSSESCKVLLPETFSFDVTMDEIANSIDQYIVEHNMKINRNTEEYTELLHNFCVSDFPDLTETELRYYQAYASVYLSGSMDESTYISNDSKTIGEIRKENQEISERILEAATQSETNKIKPRFSSYNLYDARKYAETYAITPNIEYYYFEQDCTNFASQILHAGGMPKNNDWDPNILHGAGRAHWLNAGGFTQYWSLMRGFAGAVCSSVNEVKSNADAGDFISWQNKDTHSFYHVQFVQSKTADREIYCTQHTPNYYNVKFSSRVSDSKFANEYAFIIDFY